MVLLGTVTERQRKIIRELGEAPDPNDSKLQELAQQLVEAARRTVA